MPDEILKFCENFANIRKEATILDDKAEKFVQSHEEFFRHHWKDILTVLCFSKNFSLLEKYVLIHHLADIVKCADFTFGKTRNPTFSEVTPEMKFFHKFVREWDSFYEKDIDFNDWSDLCERGLALLMDFIRSPSRMKKDFLCDDEYDAFKTDYSTRYKVLRLKYESLNQYW